MTTAATRERSRGFESRRIPKVTSLFAALLLLAGAAAIALAGSPDAEPAPAPDPVPVAYGASASPDAGGGAASAPSDRSGYSYVRLVTGDATLNNRWNGTVEVRRNLPITAGDEIQVSDAARVEVGLADGNVLEIGGGTRAQFASLYAQQGEDDEFSAISLRDGSVLLAALGRDENGVPRIDTDDATVYVSPGGRARVNFDPRRGTSVVVRAGSIEVKTRTGSYRLRAGQYLMVRGEEEPEIARGSFSRDRFDLWASDRMDSIAESTRTVSARYVDEDYSSDVEALDGYGDWNYSPTYSAYVWTPHVDIQWTPFMNGSWYYTPAGLTWWSSDPWGWFPHHYGNWYFEAAWNRWCWSPAAVYSPAWVYWAYSGSYVGWCPIGWYSGYGPWWSTYYRNHRGGAYLAINGTFRPREIDFRGWNFTGANRFGAGFGRAEIVRGDRIAGQLGTQVAISSRPIVVNARPGEAREAIRQYVREAPRVIERASTGDSSRLAPILARERTLPPASVEALRERTVVPERGRLAGPAAAELAPRGVTVDRGRVADAVAAPSAGDRSVVAPASPGSRGLERGRVEAPAAASGGSAADWRTRGRSGDNTSVAPPARVERARPEIAPPSGAPSADWRSRRLERGNPEADARGGSTDWRTREVPPARRVIDHAVPGRRPIERDETAPSSARPDDSPRARSVAPRAESPAPRRPEVSRPEAPPVRESAPPPRAEPRPAPRAEPPRAERSAPAPRPAPPAHQPPDRGRKD